MVSASVDEALPTALIEAGASGLPVVATDAGGTREIVVDGVTGRLVPFATYRLWRRPCWKRSVTPIWQPRTAQPDAPKQKRCTPCRNGLSNLNCSTGR